MRQDRCCLQGELEPAGKTAEWAYAAIRRGLVPKWSNGTGTLASFGGMCVSHDRLDVLIAVAEAGWPRAAGEEVGRTPAEWLDELCSWDLNFRAPGTQPSRMDATLFDVALDNIRSNSRDAVAFVMRVAPEHPAIAKHAATAGEAGAIVREVAMERRIASEAARPNNCSPTALRRRRAVI
ncbi:hypothetical protein [Methylibium petroleiphilum]|uniref:Uncharacterized protein n=1 Tax=Methylibium petroleiphilum (strain ATCC BAA-1232 / LMG 22953 / PM1) TaxID=420662 RepID=A2SPB2_METPP|nr:hypothetical protein Mpe_B0637 [Methylibium petroleiphilum PM1]